MNKINFENAPSTNTPLSAENLNQMQANIEEAIEEKHIYSVEERRVGTWINGKPLYQKTIIINNTSATDSIYYPMGIDNLDFALINYGLSYCSFANTNSFPINRTKSGERLEAAVDTGWLSIINIDAKDYAGWTFVVVVEYTKTTD